MLFDTAMEFALGPKTFPQNPVTGIAAVTVEFNNLKKLSVLIPIKANAKQNLQN